MSSPLHSEPGLGGDVSGGVGTGTGDGDGAAVVVFGTHWKFSQRQPPPSTHRVSAGLRAAQTLACDGGGGATAGTQTLFVASHAHPSVAKEVHSPCPRCERQPATQALTLLVGSACSARHSGNAAHATAGRF